MIKCKDLIILISRINHKIRYIANRKNIKEYRIERIKKRNNWYFIYASRNESLFKIVSKETTDEGKYVRHDKIRRHKKYYLILESYSDNAPVVNGVKVVILGYAGGFYEKDKR